MAVVKLGAFVTQLVGSIGGTTFRRFKNTLVCQNKQRGVSSNILLKNLALPRMAGVNYAWSNLSVSARIGWETNAFLYPFKNRFGESVYLSGRELYIKLMGNLSNTQSVKTDFTVLNSFVNEVYISNFTANLSQGFWLQLNDEFTYTWLLIQMEIMRNEFTQPTFTRRQILEVKGLYVPDIFELDQNFRDRFPYLYGGEWVRVYITPMNECGFKGVTQSAIAQVVG